MVKRSSFVALDALEGRPRVIAQATDLVLDLEDAVGADRDDPVLHLSHIRSVEPGGQAERDAREAHERIVLPYGAHQAQPDDTTRAARRSASARSWPRVMMPRGYLLRSECGAALPLLESAPGGRTGRARTV